MQYFLHAAIAAVLTLATSSAAAEKIASAQFAAPVERYGHFALGRPHEYARLVVSTDTGRRLVFELPHNEVFEDLAPRLIEIAQGEPQEILAIVSQRDSGSRLMMLRLSGNRIEISAQSQPIGTPMRWLNPVGVADLDGDGRAEIAAVITPHIGGILKVYKKQGRELVEISALDGFSNHINGTAELALSLPFVMAGKMRLLVPSTTRQQLRIVELDKGRLVEIGRCPLLAPITDAMRVMSPTEVSLGLLTGRQTIAPENCIR